ncbi:MAG: aminotransferase class V-fold PLP-dependent enzyme [Oscillospiraceae bacterium]|nr:aminotransferase class V-fold PLP-dependent enzyme [Oscillospiraceae bacterium]
MFVYADNAATMPLSPAALSAMRPFLEENYGNASSIYSVARDARRALEDARRTIAGALGAAPEEIYFTAGGTEADNWALVGACEAKRNQGGQGGQRDRGGRGAQDGRHMIVSAIEHHAVLHTAQHLQKQGFELTVLPVDKLGRVAASQVQEALRPDTVLVSCMTANNEVGTIQPIEEIGRLCHASGVWFHTDAVQAIGHIPLDLSSLPVDMLSLSGHKFGGPKGIGALFLRRGVRLPPLLHGGGHERGLRSGTENVAGAVGMAAALRESTLGMAEDIRRTSAMRDRLIAALSAIPYAFLTGDPENRLPGNASFVFACVEGESLVLNLDMAGVCASSGSACSSGSLDPSHVLLALGLPHEVAHGSLRLTISGDTTPEQVDYLISQVIAAVARGRAMSPLWDAAAQKPIQ